MSKVTKNNWTIQNLVDGKWVNERGAIQVSDEQLYDHLHMNNEYEVDDIIRMFSTTGYFDGHYTWRIIQD